MRLKLNKTLRAALIAAITTVGFTTFGTGSSAMAGEYTEAVTLPGASTFWNKNSSGTSTGFADSSSTINITAGAVYATLVAAPNAQPDNLYYGCANGAPGYGSGDVTITTAGDKSISFNTVGRGGNGGEYAAITLSMDSVLAPRHADTDVLTSVTFTFTNNKAAGAYSAWGHVENATEVVSLGGGAKATASGVNTIVLDADQLANMDELVFVIGNNKNDTQVTLLSVTSTFSDAPVAESLTWNGSVGNNELTSAVWDDGQSKTAAYSSTAPLVFGAEGYKEVAISTAATAKSMEVQGSGYEFVMGDGASLTVKTLTVAQDASLTTSGEGTVTINTLTGAGDLVKGDSGTMALTGANSGFTGDLTVSAGTLSISKASSLGTGTHTVGSGAVIEVTNASMAAVGTLTVEGEGTVRLVTTSRSESGNALGAVTAPILELADNSDHTGRYYYGGSTNLTGVGHLKFAGGQLWLTSDMTLAGDVTFGTTTYTESNDFAEAAMRVNASGTFNGAVDVQDTAKLVWGESNKTLEFADTVTGSGDINLIGWNGKTGTFKISGNASAYTGALTTNDKITLNVTSTGELRIGSGSSLVGAVTLDGALTVDGDATISGNITGAGSLTKTGEGELVLSGTANALGNTIQAKGGTLTMTGTYAIDNISGGGIKEDFVDNTGATAASGFSRKSGSITVYKEDGGKVDFTNATFTLGGQQVEATGGVVTVDAKVDYTTLYVNDMSAPVDFAAHQAYAQSQGSGITGVVLKNETAVENVSGTVGVTLAEGTDVAFVHASGATTISGISGWSNNELLIQGDEEVTMAGQTLTGSQKLQVAGTVSTTGALTVNGGTASLVVTRDATLNVTGNMTPVHGRVEISGEVNISSELDLSKGKTSDVVLNIDSNGKVSANGMWMHSQSSIVMEELGEFDIAGLSIIGKTGSGISYLGAAGTDSPYSTTNANYQIANANVTATGNVTIGNTLVGVDVVTGDNAVTLNTNADSVTVSDGGTFTKGTGATVGTINVEDGGTIAGGVDAKEVKIDAAGTATFLQGINEEGVQLGWSESAAVTNMKGEAAAYGGIHDADMQVSTDVLMAESNEAVTVDNKLVVTEIMNGGLGTLTLTNVDTQALQSVVAYAGDVTLQNVDADPIELENLSLYGNTVAAYTTGVETSDQETTVTVTDVLEVVGGGTLLANLEMADDSALLLNGAGDNALVLGSTLDLGTGIKLDAITLQALDAMSLGETLMLVKAADDTELGYLGDAEWFGQVFSRSASEGGYDLIGDYSVLADADGFGLVKVSNTPEPTTGTLSLLALCALAARRRRK